MINRLIFSILISLISLLSPAYANATNDKFRLSYDITYAISETGKTKVVHRTTIINLTSDNLAGKTSLVLSNLNILNPKAYDNYGSLKFKTSTDSSTIKFDLDLPNSAAGKDNSYTWTLSYDTMDLVVKQGNNYQISIPNPGDVDDFKISVVVPPAFGKPTIIRPSPSKGLVWTKDSLGSTGINLMFSPELSPQYYRVNLRYSLENKKTSPIVAQIPIPSSTAYQRFYWEESSVRPLDVASDNDGNWLAKFYLGAGVKEEISVTGIAELYSKPILTEYASPASVSAQNKISSIAHLNDLPSLYQYTIKNYIFDPKISSNRKFDDLVETKDKVGCQEITTLLSTFAKDKGFVIRPVFGLLYPNRDRFHCWLSYYDSRTHLFTNVDPILEQSSSGWDFYNQTDLSHLQIWAGDKYSPSSVPLLGIEAKPTLEFNPEISLPSFIKDSVRYWILSIPSSRDMVIPLL